MNRLFTRIAFLGVALTSLAMAQMGGGMPNRNGGGMMGPGNSGAQGTTGMNLGQGMGGGMGMSGAMGSREMMDGPTVGPDGTVYMVRRASGSTGNQGMLSSSANPSTYELVAMSARDGAAKWKLEIAGTMISEPSLAKDGKLFVTASDFAMSGQNQTGGGMMTPGSSATSHKARLIIVTADLTSARISNTVELESDILSAPRTATDETGSYVVYVTGFKMGANNNDVIAGGEKYLYAFTPEGNIKFSVKISQP